MIPTFLSIFVPALAATEFTVWALWVDAPRRAYKRHRAWLEGRPNYRPVLRQYRAETRALPASFETGEAA